MGGPEGYAVSGGVECRGGRQREQDGGGEGWYAVHRQ